MITVGPLLEEDTTKPNVAAGGEGRPKQFQLDLYYKKTPQNQTWQREGKEDLNNYSWTFIRRRQHKTKRGSRRGRKT